MLRVAVVGGGPSGSCAAEVLARAGIKTWLFERKLDNAKPCGGAIPLCMVEEFDLPDSIIDRKVRNMKMISPSNREVDIKLDPLGYDDNAYIGMCRREVFDSFLRNRAADLGTTLVNGLVQKIDTGDKRQGPYTLHYADYSAGGPTGEMKSLEVDLIIGADGANSRVAKAMDAGDYKVAIAFQERIKLPPEEMAYYEDLAEMYVGTDVSPDFYAWVFPKYDHVAVGPGTMQQKPSYSDCALEVSEQLLETARALKSAGHPEELIALDPGIGFGKTLDHNIELLQNHNQLRGIEGFALLWGVSRKSMIGELTGRSSTSDRLAGTLAVAALAHYEGIDLLRVHDVREHVDMLNVLDARA